MTKHVTQSAKLAALIKKTAQKLVKNPKSIHKELKKLALTLPLMALLIEEVRAAQSKVSIDAMSVTGEVFEDQQALVEFIDAQNLDDAQYTEVEQELDGVLLATADPSPEDNQDDAATHLPHHDSGVGVEHQFGDGGMSLMPEDQAAAGAPAPADDPFALSSLPIVAVPGVGLGVAAGVAGTAAVFNNLLNTGTTTATPAADAPITFQADGTHLSTSLKDLQKLGVDFVNPAAGETSLNLDLGAGTSISSTTGLPLFGDTNRDGLISTAEDNALIVNLLANDATQLSEIASLPDLASFGVDNVQLSLANQQALNTLLSNNTLAVDLAAIRAHDLSVSTIDMGTTSVVHISQAQAGTLIADSLHFVANDNITLDATLDASHTHLSTSLKDLQKLGVDAVAITGSGVVSVDMGDLTAADLSTGVAIASFDDALTVTLDVANTSQLAAVTGLGTQLHTAHIDAVQLNLTGQTELNALLAADVGTGITISVLDTELSALSTHGLQVSTIDMVTTDVVTLSEVQASALLQDGLHFAANDHISLQAAHTHLSTSLKDLQKLGVDAVSAVGGVQDIHLDLGGGDALSLGAGVLPMFDDNLNVTLDVANAAQLHELASLLIPSVSTAAPVSLHALHIDQVELHIDNQATFDTLLVDNHFAADIAAIQQEITAAHVAVIDAVAPLHITQSQANTLQTEGLHFAANDHVTFDVNAVAATHAATSLKDIAKLGLSTLAVSDHGTDGSHIDTAHFAQLAQAVHEEGFAHLGLFSSDLLHNQNLLDAVHGFDWASSGLDMAVQVDAITNNGSVDGVLSGLHFAGINGGIDLLTGSGLSADETWGSLITTLKHAGLGDVEIEKNADNTVHINDDLSAALYESGMLHALPDAKVAIDAGANKVLNTSLKAMADLGVDSVNADHKVYVELGIKPQDIHSIADLGELFSAFGLHTNAPDAHLFGTQGAGLVLDQTTFSTLGAQDIQTLVTDLTKLGFTEIDVMGTSKVEHVYDIKVVAQTPVVSEVQIVGTAATDLAHVFDPDILGRKIHG
jgi:hypothetical protein